MRKHNSMASMELARSAATPREGKLDTLNLTRHRAPRLALVGLVALVVAGCSSGNEPFEPAAVAEAPNLDGRVEGCSEDGIYFVPGSDSHLFRIVREDGVRVAQIADDQDPDAAEGPICPVQSDAQSSDFARVIQDIVLPLPDGLVYIPPPIAEELDVTVHELVREDDK
ncbi:hypothetical protein [Arthrobacter rhombi]|uniref:hypothetical protein n=1 Tax=Arthrobacter rhombi TaxID=71253 RepID=UPI003FD51BF8